MPKVEIEPEELERLRAIEKEKSKEQGTPQMVEAMCKLSENTDMVTIAFAFKDPSQVAFSMRVHVPRNEKGQFPGTIESQFEVAGRELLHKAKLMRQERVTAEMQQAQQQG